MKKPYIIISLLFSFGLSGVLQAQSLGEAVQYSSFDYLGTARMAGVGGAFGALGGDQGAIYSNPASLGTYWKSEFVISPSYFASNTSSSFNGSVKSGNAAVDISARNLGFVFHAKGGRSSKWKTSNISISYNKVTDFEKNISFDGISTGSIMQRFAERANGKNLNQLDPFEAGVAYDADALYDLEGNLQYDYDPLDDQDIERKQLVRADGGMSELNLAWGGNYNDIFQFGFSLGIPYVNYTHTKTYREKAVEETSPFVDLTYVENLKTKGSGINLKLGLIATPGKSVRIGVSVASPTSFSLDDNYSTTLDYNYLNSQGIESHGEAESVDGSFSYNFITPWKTTGSIAYLLKAGKIKGFLSAEFDYLNYKSSYYDLTAESDNFSDQELQEDLNGQIHLQLKDANNLRLGGELAYDIFRVRAGYKLNGSPYFKDKGTYFSGISVGGGLRFDKFFFDIAYSTNSSQQGYYPYVSLNEDNVQFVSMDTRNSYVTSTFGFKF